jgi:hypothetical protein
MSVRHISEFQMEAVKTCKSCWFEHGRRQRPSSRTLETLLGQLRKGTSPGFPDQLVPLRRKNFDKPRSFRL